ncbi:MAG: GyrI-like domain-containing protein [Acidobacteria bacterium]|jgi:effector-binding domain-containing protein|nr:GyrI-like domain-containing protein [Acidobacteriota bacterium]
MKKSISIIFIFILFVSFIWAQEPAQQKTVEQKPAEQTNKNTIPPVVKEIGGFWYVYVPARGPYEDIIKVFSVLKEEKTKQGFKVTGKPLVLYWNHPKVSEQPGRYIWAVCVPVAEDTVVNPPIKKAFFEKKMAAVCVHIGSAQDIVQSNDVLDKFIDDNDYITVWPVYEVFNPDGSIEITHPVKKIEY